MVTSKALILLIIAALLGGCAANPKITASPTFVCVEIKKYSREQQNRMADELEKHADQIPAVAEAIDDYGNLRSAIRKVCNRKQG